MKFIGKVLLTLSLLLTLSAALCYMLLETAWAASWMSQWVSNNSEYRLSLKKIDHSWSQPGKLSFNDVILSSSGHPPILSAQRVVLSLNWRQLTHLHHLHSVLLQNGTLIIDNTSPILPVQAETLQLSNMTVKVNVGKWQVEGQQVNAGLTPWQPQPDHLLGNNNIFQISASSLTINGIAALRVFVQGKLQKKAITLTNFGASLARGELTGNVNREEDGSWQIAQLRLSNIGIQTTQTLQDVWQTFIQLPPIGIKRLELINACLEGKNWAFNNLDLTLKDVKFNQEDWQSNDGELTMSAANIISGNIQLTDPIMTLGLSPNGIAIKQFLARWQDGLLKSQGNWVRASHRLQLDDMAVASLIYSLPPGWQQYWQQNLPNWFSEIFISKLTINRNLLIDTTPEFPFQITSLDGFGTDLLLARDHQWGIWAGTLKLNASDATFNKNDMRYFSLDLTANEQQITFNDLSALTNDGLLEATAHIGQPANRPFSLVLTGRSVDLNILQNWGWPALPLLGNGKLQLKLNGSLAGNETFKNSLNGSLQATDSNRIQIHQLIQQGEVSAVKG